MPGDARRASEELMDLGDKSRMISHIHQQVADAIGRLADAAVRDGYPRHVLGHYQGELNLRDDLPEGATAMVMHCELLAHGGAVAVVYIEQVQLAGDAFQLQLRSERVLQ